MRKSSPAQLALIDLPAPPRRGDAARRRAQAAMNARNCEALLAALDRIPAPTEAPPAALSPGDERRARQLMALYDAWERSSTEARGEEHGARDAGHREGHRVAGQVQAGEPNVAAVEAAEIARLAGARPLARQA